MLDYKKVLDFLTLQIKKYRHIFIVACVGLVLLAIPPASKSSGASDAKNKKEEAPAVEKTQMQYDEAGLEQRLSDIFSDVNGVGRVKVIFTYKGSRETVYAKDVRENTRVSAEDGNITDKETEEESEIKIVSGGSGSETPVMVKQVYPEFMGVLIVCDGADNADIRLKLTNAVMALTGISSENISIIRMKK